jgi:hypothetical protein
MIPLTALAVILTTFPMMAQEAGKDGGGNTKRRTQAETVADPAQPIAAPVPKVANDATQDPSIGGTVFDTLLSGLPGIGKFQAQSGAVVRWPWVLGTSQGPVKPTMLGPGPGATSQPNTTPGTGVPSWMDEPFPSGSPFGIITNKEYGAPFVIPQPMPPSSPKVTAPFPSTQPAEGSPSANNQDGVPVRLNLRKSIDDQDEAQETTPPIRLTRRAKARLPVTPKAVSVPTDPPKAVASGKPGKSVLPALPTLPSYSDFRGDDPKPTVGGHAQTGMRVRGPIGWTGALKDGFTVAPTVTRKPDGPPPTEWWNNPTPKGGDPKATWSHHDTARPMTPAPIPVGVRDFIASLPDLDDTQNRKDWGESLVAITSSLEHHPTTLRGHLRKVATYNGQWGPTVLFWIGGRADSAPVECVIVEVHSERLLPALNMTMIKASAVRGDRVEAFGYPRVDTETPYRSGIYKASPWGLSPTFSMFLDTPNGRFPLTRETSVRDRSWEGLHALIPESKGR